VKKKMKNSSLSKRWLLIRRSALMRRWCVSKRLKAGLFGETTRGYRFLSWRKNILPKGIWRVMRLCRRNRYVRLDQLKLVIWRWMHQQLLLYSIHRSLSLWIFRFACSFGTVYRRGGRWDCRIAHGFCAWLQYWRINCIMTR
jgi:hypothetical protein